MFLNVVDNVRFFKKGYHWGEQTPMRPEPNRQWVYGSLFLYSALLSHFWSM